jgi:hypothetical protein
MTKKFIITGVRNQEGAYLNEFFNSWIYGVLDNKMKVVLKIG